MTLLHFSIPICCLPTMVRLYPLLACLLLLLPFTQAQQADSSQQSSVLKYEPSTVGNYAVGAVYAIFSFTFFAHIFRLKDWWALCLPIGGFISAAGFCIRPSMDPLDLQLGLYIAQQFFVVISPVTFLAFNYMLYGRLLSALDPDMGDGKKARSRFSLLPPRLVARVFVWSDVTTFIIQAAAGGLQASGSDGGSTMAQVGDKMFLIGVTLQGISYCLFTTLLTVALYRYYREHASLDRWTVSLAAGLYFSSVFIIIRSIYRIVEFAQGYDGYLISKEGEFSFRGPATANCH